MDINTILIIIGVVVGLALLIKFRKWVWMILVAIFYVARWALFIPLAFLFSGVLNLINIGQLIAGYIISNISYTMSVIVDAISIVQDVAFVIFPAAFIAPRSRLGAIIASVACLAVEGYNLATYKVCTIFNLGPGVDVIDWTHASVMLVISVIVMGVIIYIYDK